MIIGFVLAIVGTAIGLVCSTFGLLLSLVISAAFLVMLLIGTILLSPVLLWLGVAIAAVCLIRCGRWLERTPRS